MKPLKFRYLIQVFFDGGYNNIIFKTQIVNNQNKLGI